MTVISLFILAQLPTPPEIEDIAPPLPTPDGIPWVWIGLAIIAILIVLVLAVRFWRRPATPLTPDEVVTKQLAAAEAIINTMTPYKFSIVVADILRQYVSDAFGLPAPQQTSTEFLTSIQEKSLFSGESGAQLEKFLTRCDAIKFSRRAATHEDSRELLASVHTLIAAQSGGQST